jgi:hypothetical protein
MTTYYIIRHKPTGAWMPQMRGGFSYWEPTFNHNPPRLFNTARAAKNALTCWLQGRWSQGMTSGDFWDPPEPTRLEPHAVPGRRGEDMEVVAVTLA